jgi:CRP-like cAMP-binding protein
MILSIRAPQAAEARNTILNALPAEQRNWILSNATHQSLPAGMVLIEANAPIQFVYFIEEGVAALTAPLSKARRIEAFTVGREGIVGLPLFLGCDRMGLRAFQQIAGSAYRVPKAVFVEEVNRSTELRRLLGGCAHAILATAAIRSGCNAVHSVEQRFARWLLTTDDQVAGAAFRITHEFVGQLLGVRRATVTVVSGLLEEAGYISNDRATFRVRNRIGLEAITCECYALTRAEHQRQLQTS